MPLLFVGADSFAVTIVRGRTSGATRAAASPAVVRSAAAPSVAKSAAPSVAAPSTASTSDTRRASLPATNLIATGIRSALFGDFEGFVAATNQRLDELDNEKAAKSEVVTIQGLASEIEFAAKAAAENMENNIKKLVSDEVEAVAVNSTKSFDRCGDISADNRHTEFRCSDSCPPSCANGTVSSAGSITCTVDGPTGKVKNCWCTHPLVWSGNMTFDNCAQATNTHAMGMAPGHACPANCPGTVTCWVGCGGIKDCACDKVVTKCEVSGNNAATRQGTAVLSAEQITGWTDNQRQTVSAAMTNDVLKVNSTALSNLVAEQCVSADSEMNFAACGAGGAFVVDNADKRVDMLDDSCSRMPACMRGLVVCMIDGKTGKAKNCRCTDSEAACIQIVVSDTFANCSEITDKGFVMGDASCPAKCSGGVTCWRNNPCTNTVHDCKCNGASIDEKIEDAASAASVAKGIQDSIDFAKDIQDTMAEQIRTLQDQISALQAKADVPVFAPAQKDPLAPPVVEVCAAGKTCANTQSSAK